MHIILRDKATNKTVWSGKWPTTLPTVGEIVTVQVARRHDLAAPDATQRNIRGVRQAVGNYLVETRRFLIHVEAREDSVSMELGVVKLD